jgi:hypothetical protein
MGIKEENHEIKYITSKNNVPQIHGTQPSLKVEFIYKLNYWGSSVWVST